MDIDPKIAAALGFPRPHYTAVERERRWLCEEAPSSLVRQTLTITDLYVTGARLRLREMRPIDGGPGMLKLTRKGDVDAYTRLITSIYLPEDEFAILSATLTGARLSKVRHRLHAPVGISMSVDEFEGKLAGLRLLEVEFETAADLVAFAAPDFAGAEMTSDARYTGAALATNGLPR